MWCLEAAAFQPLHPASLTLQQSSASFQHPVVNFPSSASRELSHVGCPRAGHDGTLKECPVLAVKNMADLGILTHAGG